MKKKNLIIWMCSVVLYILDLIPFFYFMFKPSSKVLALTLICVAITTVFYILSKKKIMHENGYSALQAITFYKHCVENKLTDVGMCKNNPEQFRSVGDNFDFARKLKVKELCEMYEIGCELSNKKG